MRGLDGMRALNEAWEVLKDAARRAAFDAEGSSGGAGAQGAGAAARRSHEDPNRPFWTGAMGPPPGRPSGPVLDWGIFAGWSLGEISRRDRGYLMWLRDRPEAKAHRAEIGRLLDPTADEQPPEPPRGRRR
jgi:curved DNA-binding protein CbpA